MSGLYEFHKGNWDRGNHEFWKKDSIYMHDDIMYNLNFDALIHQVVPEYNPFGETKISKAQWMDMGKLAMEIGGEILELVKEADAWVQDAFAEHEVFTILGL